MRVLGVVLAAFVWPLLAWAGTATAADYDSSFRRALRRLLSGAGFTVATFASAEEFLASNSSRATDCLVLESTSAG